MCRSVGQLNFKGHNFKGQVHDQNFKGQVHDQNSKGQVLGQVQCFQLYLKDPENMAKFYNLQPIEYTGPGNPRLCLDRFFLPIRKIRSIRG